MIPGRHKTATIQEDCIFQAKYMGYTSNTEPGVSGIDRAVKKIHDRMKNEDKTCSRITVEVNKEGMTFIYNGSQKRQFFALRDISYCSLNRFDTSIFAFNHHISKSPLKVECHAVLCNSEEKARAIGQSLYSAYREGHFEELRKERKKKITSSGLEPQTEKTNEENPCTDSHATKTEVKAGVLDKELDNIVKDMLDTVEREKENMDEPQ